MLSSVAHGESGGGGGGIHKASPTIYQPHEERYEPMYIHVKKHPFLYIGDGLRAEGARLSHGPSSAKRAETRDLRLCCSRGAGPTAWN